MAVSIYLTLKGHFPICSLFDNCNGTLPALPFYHPDAMKAPLRRQLIEWHTSLENDVFDFAKEIHGYCKADVQLLNSGCIKFRDAFITYTGIDLLQGCTIAGASMNVLRTSPLKLKYIGLVPVNDYFSLINYSFE